MAFAAVEPRPGMASAAMFLVIAMAPWRVHHACTEVGGIIVSAAGDDDATETAERAAARPIARAPLSIELPDVVPMPNGGAAAAWEHPDAQPWPRGMVITPPPHPDHNTLVSGSPLDILLSVLLGPLHVLGA